MYQLTVGIGVSAFEKMVQPLNEFGTCFDKIRQHRIIISPKIINYYVEHLPEYLRDSFKYFIDDINTNDEQSVSYPSIEDLNAIEELIHYVSSVPYKPLIAYSSEFDKDLLKKVKLITLEDIRECKNNPITKYSFPIVSHLAKPGEPCDAYAKWFENLLSNEHSITIVDQFIMKSYGISVLNRYYFPCFSDGAKVNILCDFEACGHTDKSELLQQIGQTTLSRLDISIRFCTNMHERYILTDNFVIVIGRGLDFLNLSGTLTGDCFISAKTNIDSIELPPEDPFLNIN